MIGWTYDFRQIVGVLPSSEDTIRIAMATSTDGMAWDRRGAVLEPAGEGPDGLGVHTPCAVRFRDGSIGMWYAGIPVGDDEMGYRICFARFPGPWGA